MNDELRKLKKIAYALWEYETKNTYSDKIKLYSKKIKNDLEIFFKGLIDNKLYQQILYDFSIGGIIHSDNSLGSIYYKIYELLKNIMLIDEESNKHIIDIDD